MEFNGKIFICNNGNMLLSERMNNFLIQRFSLNCHPRESNEEIQKSDSWYCPGCGVPLKNDFSCILCSNSLSDLKYELLEFHPHF